MVAQLKFCEWISNFFANLISEAITYPWWDKNYSMLLKKNIGLKELILIAMKTHICGNTSYKIYLHIGTSPIVVQGIANTNTYWL